MRAKTQIKLEKYNGAESLVKQMSMGMNVASNIDAMSILN